MNAMQQLRLTDAVGQPNDVAIDISVSKLRAVPGCKHRPGFPDFLFANLHEPGQNQIVKIHHLGCQLQDLGDSATGIEQCLDEGQSSKFRESRDESSNLTFLSGEDRLKTIKEMEVYVFETNGLVSIERLFDLQ